jgi:glycosyltransferase involved in cell wall biosynthesis
VAKLSVIVPARNELYLQRTITDLLSKAVGDVEVIAILDGYWPDPPLKEDPRLTYVHRERRGMRASINAGVGLSKGQYLMKIDAHCIVCPGYDEILQRDCDKDWIVVPRRYSLEMDTWDVRRHRPFVDYEYLSWPYRQKRRKSGMAMCGMVWDERIASRINILLDETMTFQGSCWFMPKEHFLRQIGKMNEDGYGTFVEEAEEIGLKTWLGGGKAMVNKKCWYGHLWKGVPYRTRYNELFGQVYSRVGWQEQRSGNRYAIDYWMHNRWEERVHDFEWLIDRFWPVPSWPEDKTKWIP